MSLLEAQTVAKNPVPGEDELLLYDNSKQAEVVGDLKPSDLFVQVLHRPGEPIHDMTQDSIYAWLDEGISYTRMRDPFGGWINTTRNWQTRLFLKKTASKYLLLIDADVGVPWHALYKLAKHELPVVSGVVPCYSEQYNGLFLNIAVKDPNGTARFPTLEETKVIPEDGVIECHNAGCGCLLVRRDVIEKMWEMYDEDNSFGQPFELTVEEMREAGKTGTVPRGEDICFTDRVRAAGFKVWADFGARCVHDKMFPMAWPGNAIKKIDVADWAVSVFDYKVKTV